MYALFISLCQAAASSDPSTLSLVAGAIPVIGGIASALINNSNVAANNDANRQFQLEQQQQQESYNTDMWNMQNAYNTPAAQMSRLELAGLNPNLVYGNGGGTTGNVAEPPAPAPHVEYVSQPSPYHDFGADAAEGLMAFNSTRMAGAQSNLLQQQSSNTAEDTVLKIAQEVNTDADTNLKTADATGQSIQNLFSGDAMKADIAQKLASAKYTLTQNQTAAIMQSPTLANALQQLVNLKADAAKTDADRALILQQGQNLLNDNKVQQMDLLMRRNGMMPHDSFGMRVIGGIINSRFSKDGAAPMTGSTDAIQYPNPDGY